MTRKPTLFQCADGDFEGDLPGAIHHCDITGHVLQREDNNGTVVTVELDSGEDP